MYITKSNILLNVEPTSVSTGSNPDYDKASVTDPDFSTFYVSSNSTTLVFEFGSTSEINYIAVAGLNIEGAKDFTSRVSVLDSGAYMATNYVSMNNCILVTFTSRSFSNLRVVIKNPNADTRPRVAFIAGGEAFEVPNGGEVSGYNRQFLNRNVKSKSTLSDIAAPIAFLTKKVSAKGSLSLPNMTIGFSESTWQDFLDFATSNLFFIREQDPTPTITNLGETTNNNSAYLCFDLTANKVSAHGQTRALNNLSASFKVFNGL